MYTSVCRGKRKGRRRVCVSQDTETRALYFCMCTSKRGVVLLYVSALKADRARKKKECVNHHDSSSTAVQGFKDLRDNISLVGVFHNAKGIRR